MLAATVMPDHIHLLVELSGRLTVSQLVAKVKGGITRRCAGVRWQLNFFEHRLRHRKTAEDFALYIFMNPYCANLCPINKTWLGWIPARNVR